MSLDPLYVVGWDWNMWRVLLYDDIHGLCWDVILEFQDS